MRCKGLASVAEENVGVGGLEAPDGAFQNFVAPGPERLVAAALASHLEDGHLRRVDSPDEAPGIGIEAVVAVGLAGERPELGDRDLVAERRRQRSEEHTSELQSLMRISYAVFCLNKKK